MYFSWHFCGQEWPQKWFKTCFPPRSNSKLTKANSELSQKLTELEKTSKCYSDISLYLLPLCCLSVLFSLSFTQWTFFLNEESETPAFTTSFKVKPSDESGPGKQSLISYIPWTKAELHAITKDFLNPKEDSIGFAREFLAIQAHEPAFSDLYQLNHMLIREGHAREWLIKVGLQNPTRNFPTQEWEAMNEGSELVEQLYEKVSDAFPWVIH